MTRAAKILYVIAFSAAIGNALGLGTVVAYRGTRPAAKARPAAKPAATATDGCNGACHYKLVNGQYVLDTTKVNCGPPCACAPTAPDRPAAIAVKCQAEYE